MVNDNIPACSQAAGLPAAPTVHAIASQTAVTFEHDT